MRLVACLCLVGCGSKVAPPPAARTCAPAPGDEMIPEPRCVGDGDGYRCLGWASDNDGGVHREAFVDRAGGRRAPWSPLCGAPVERVELPPGEVRALGGVRVRFDNHLHEGDASFEWSATLTVMCGNTERVIDLDALAATGPRAVAFTSRGAHRHAISLVGEDGGEGTEYHTIETIVLDEARTCVESR